MNSMTTMELILIALNGVILPLTSWVLYSVTSMQKQLAVEAVYGQGHAQEILELRTRVTAVEAQLVELRIRMGREDVQR